ncbi:MAG: glucose-1-phosphate thymidylyltransferase RfbA [Prochlorococcus marinus CUG1436]|nr:glucose-1-phosphate thymidylyltransferase RfbA [Prochlorococcus marinus CUG1436]
MNIKRKGIILAGGSGSRLYPITKGVCKQLLPVYDKPMIYYPLSTLMLAGVRDILIITKIEDIDKFKNILGNGDSFGINLQYEIQEKPEGLAQAFLIGESFLDGSPSILILGDNLFYGKGLGTQLKEAYNRKNSTIFAYPVSDPERYGIVDFAKDGRVIGIEEKPSNPKSKYAITGLYFYDETVVEKAKQIRPSKRGELEISDLNNIYLEEKSLSVELFNRGMAWLDTGTTESLLDASFFIKTIEFRQGLKISCPEEIAWRQGWIDDEKLLKLAQPLIKSGYGEYIISLLEN